MTPALRRVHSPARRGPGSSFPLSLGLVFAAGLALAGSALAGPGVLAPGGNLPSPLAWSNGEILCNFTSDHPAVTVSALGSHGNGLYAGLFEVDELSPSGATVANASLVGASWSIANTSTPQMLELRYTALIPLQVAGSTASPGYASVAVNMSTEYDTDSADNSSFVTLQVGVQHWAWVHPQDTLAVRAPVWPATGEEHLASPATVASELDSRSVASGQTVEYLQWGSEGAAVAANGTPVNVPVESEVDFGAQYSTVTWSFGSAASSGSHLTFDARIGIVVPGRVLGIPVYEYVAVGGAAAAVGLVAAVGLRRVRQRPSSLEYVDEGGPA